jgi:hypothetical protein
MHCSEALWKNEERNDILRFSDFLVVNFCYFAKNSHPSFCSFYQILPQLPKI